MRLFILIFWLLLLHFCVLSIADAQLITQITDHAPGQLILKLKTPQAGVHASSTTLPALVDKLGSSGVLSVRRFQTDPDSAVVRLVDSSEEQLRLAIRTLSQDSRVAFAEPNWIVHALNDGVPNDPEFSKQWALNNTGQADPGGNLGLPGADLHLLPLWQEGFNGSKKVIVAVIDTGMDWNHPDLQANLYTNPGEIAGNGLDDDHNGFVDDIHGWNFNDNSPNSMDDHNHGTHCAGVIGAVRGNGIGVAGVNGAVSLMPIKFLSADGSGYMDRAVEAVNYATMMKVNVMSNSWGGDLFSQSLRDSVQRAREVGILFVTAAGNSAHDLDQKPEYPASLDLDNILTVAASDNRDRLGLFSNYGTHSVDVVAPGVRIMSTIRNGAYASMSGTSMAAPFAAGIAALLISAHPEMGYQEIKDRLIRTSTPIEALSDKSRSKGRLNAYNALHDFSPPSLPSPLESGVSHRQIEMH